MGRLSFVLRYTSFLAGCWIMLGMGSGYSFGAYSQKLGQMLDYSQSDINLMGSLGSLGVYAGAITMGVLMDVAGAVATVLVASLVVTGGWLLLFFGSLKMISHLPAVMGIYYAIQQCGAQGAFYAALVGNLGNFKVKHRGSITGILVSMYGLSAFFISQLYTRVLHSDPPALFLFMALFTFSVCITGACSLRRVHPYSTKRLSAATKLRAVGDVFSGEESDRLTTDTETDGLLSASSASSSSSNNNGDLNIPEQTPNIPRYGERGFFTLLSDPDFWLIAAFTFLTAGSGLSFISVVGSVAESWRLTDGPGAIAASTFTSVLSICNCLGRIIYGIANDVFRKRVRTVTYFFPITIAMGVTQIMMIFWNSAPALFLGTIFVGISYGGFFSIVNVVINRYYGDKNYSSNLGFKTLVLSISSLIMGQVTGKIYDHFADKSTKHCYGQKCYSITFVVTSSFCFIAVAVAFILWTRERKDDKRKAREELLVN